MKLLTLNTSSSYEIIIDSGCLKSSFRTIDSIIAADKYIIVTDSTIASIHLGSFLKSFPPKSFHVIILKPGEQSKSFKSFEDISEQILALEITRNSCLIALGGGIVGDLTGFVASTLLRGIRYIQVPTTLLAQVDSSVGGKTAINSKKGKNLIGCFHQPSLVLIDPETLRTQSRSEFINGYAEVVKYGILGDSSFFFWLESNLGALLGHDNKAVEEIIYRCCKMKKEIVEKDEKEDGDRALLNLGHTFGHAIEMLSNYSIPHGFAVSIGIVKASKFSSVKGWMKTSDLEIITSHLIKAGLPVETIYSIEDMVPYMRKDKKNKSGKITLILPKSIGSAVVVKGVEEAELLSILK